MQAGCADPHRRCELADSTDSERLRDSVVQEERRSKAHVTPPKSGWKSKCGWTWT